MIQIDNKKLPSHIIFKDNYYIDTNTNNKWSTEFINKELIFNPEFTLDDLLVLVKENETSTNCTNCINCDSCENCHDCISCIRCKFCTDCTDCIDCINCCQCCDSVECHTCHQLMFVSGRNYNENKEPIGKPKFDVGIIVNSWKELTDVLNYLQHFNGIKKSIPDILISTHSYETDGPLVVMVIDQSIYSNYYDVSEVELLNYKDYDWEVK